MWTQTITQAASLVVQHNVGPPDLVGRHPDELDPVELCRRPAQLVVIPNLTGKEEEEEERTDDFR